MFIKKNLKKLAAAAGIIVLGLLALALFIRLEGKSEAAVKISNASEFADFIQHASKGEKYAMAKAELSGSIDVSGVKIVPANGFAGSLDGKGYAVKGLNISSDKDAGLFIDLAGCVCNLSIESGRIEGGGSCGAIASRIMPEGAVLNCLNYAAVVSGDGDSGAIAGINYGTMINCASMIDRDAEGIQEITSNEKCGRLENCYTYNGGQFEIICNGTESNKADIKKRAIRNLNNRLLELSKEYNDFDFYKWELLDEFPHVKLTQIRPDFAEKVTIGEAECSYDYKLHQFIISDETEAVKGREISYITSGGNSASLICESEADEVHFWTDGIEIIVGKKPEKAGKKFSYPKKKVTVDFDDLASADKNAVKVRRIAYIGEPELGDSEETEVILAKGGDYSLKGALKGYVFSDVSDDKKHGLSLEFSNAAIEAVHTPAIWVVNDGNNENSGLSIHLADGSDNEIKASNFMNIYSAGEKFEGAISAETSVALYGDTGTLYAEGDIEGIESDSNVVMNGGNYCFKTLDDSIACKGMMLMRGGNLIVNAYDNGLDCDEIYVTGGLIAGSAMHANESFMKSNARIDGGRVAYVGKMHRLHPETAQASKEMDFKKMIAAGRYVVVVDKEKRPLIAIKLLEENDTAFFSDEAAEGADFKICDSVEGSFIDNICVDVTSCN